MPQEAQSKKSPPLIRSHNQRERTDYCTCTCSRLPKAPNPRQDAKESRTLQQALVSGSNLRSEACCWLKTSTSCTHKGQTLFCCNHLSTHLLWNLWLQGNLLSISSSPKSLRHTAHEISEVAPEQSSGQNFSSGIESIKLCCAPLGGAGVSWKPNWKE